MADIKKTSKLLFWTMEKNLCDAQNGENRSSFEHKINTVEFLSESVL